MSGNKDKLVDPKIVVKQLQAVLDTNDAAIAKVYEGYRKGTNNAWYEARAAFDILAQFRNDIVAVRKALMQKGKG